MISAIVHGTLILIKYDVYKTTKNNMCGSKHLRIPTIFIIFLASIILVTSSCGRLFGNQDLTVIINGEPRVVTLDEVQRILGTNLPLPAYSGGYEFQEILIVDITPVLIISDKPIEIAIAASPGENRQKYTVRCKLSLSYKIGNDLIPIRLPATKVHIGVNKGSVQQGGSGWIVGGKEDKELWWQWKPDNSNPETFEMVLKANRNFQNSELIKIAESIQY